MALSLILGYSQLTLTPSAVTAMSIPGCAKFLLSSPLGPLTVRTFPSMLTVTPPGIAMVLSIFPAIVILIPQYT